MKKIILISCASKKLPIYKAKAQDIYDSSLFRKSLEYARQLEPYAIYILSAKHGLLNLDTEIEPYDLTLNNMSSPDVRTWSQRVLKQLSARVDLKSDKFILLAGQKYLEFLIPELVSHEIPMQGFPIGKRLQFLSRKIDG